MQNIKDEILKGFTDIPVSGAPGLMVIVGHNAQAIFTGENPADVFLAGAEYGNGRVFVATHGCYYSWLVEKKGGLEGQFVESVKKWLTRGNGADDSNTIDIVKANENTDLSNYKLISWIGRINIGAKMSEKLRVYVENGGALYCGCTMWGYLQCGGGKKVEDYDMYWFLKNNCGIIITDRSVGMPGRSPVHKNQAKYSNYNAAIDNLSKDVRGCKKYRQTVEHNTDYLSKTGLLNIDNLRSLKDSLLAQSEKNNWNVFPSEKSPITNEDERMVTSLLCKCYIELGEKAPNVEDFPGDFSELPDLKSNIEIIVKTTRGGRLSTGYYLPAGVPFSLKVRKGDVNGCKLLIGAHTDVLNGDRFSRWPICFVSKQLKNEFNLVSPFGGLIYIESPKDRALHLLISNVVETPYFDVRRPEYSSDWNSIRNKPGLWAELAGNYIILTVPSACIRDLDNPRAITDYWDEMVKQHHKCRGTNPNEQTRERVVCDRQPGFGYMHSGYPIVTHLDICQKDHPGQIVDINKMRNRGHWGICHELGHNMQRGEWTFDGCLEVTCNIFSLHSMVEVLKMKLLEIPFVQDRRGCFESYFSKKPNYDDWKSDYSFGLMFIVQLLKHFGWGPMYEFLRSYENDMKNNKNALPKSNQDKIDQWVIRYSKIIQRNIKPQFEMWGFPVTNAVDSHVNKFEPFYPVEEKSADAFYAPK